MTRYGVQGGERRIAVNTQSVRPPFTVFFLQLRRIVVARA
jgi:hypothetical protein